MEPHAAADSEDSLGCARSAASERQGDALRCVWLPLLPRVECAKYFGEVMGTSQLPQGMPRSLLCATELAGGKDTCQVEGNGMKSEPAASRL